MHAHSFLLLQKSFSLKQRIGRHLLHRGPQEAFNFLALVPPHLGSSLLLARIHYEPSHRHYFRGDELRCACHYVFLLFPHGGTFKTKMAQREVDHNCSDCSNGRGSKCYSFRIILAFRRKAGRMLHDSAIPLGPQFHHVRQLLVLIRSFLPWTLPSWSQAIQCQESGLENNIVVSWNASKVTSAIVKKG